MQENAEKTGGSLRIQSEVGKGTELTVTLDTRSIDCLPLGDLPGTMLSLILMHPDTPDFHFYGVSPTRRVRRRYPGDTSGGGRAAAERACRCRVAENGIS